MIRQRIMAARLAEKISKDPDLARQLGITVEYRRQDRQLENRIINKRANTSTEA